MGTNYYVVKNGPSIQDPVHIGKASIGWMFSFHRQNEKWHEPPIAWNTFNQVKDWLKKYTVDSTDYVINDGEEYYCENCLSKKYTKEEYNEMYENDEAYWTEWYDD